MTEVIDSRRAIATFTSYAHEDSLWASKLMRAIDQRFKRSLKGAYTRWSDHLIPMGVDWEEEIKRAISKSDAGILLVSHAFLDSNPIWDLELPNLVAGNKILLPVMLKKVDFDTVNMGLLNGLQHFLLKSGQRPKSFEECRTSSEKTAFQNDLFNQIEQRLFP